MDEAIAKVEKLDDKIYLVVPVEKHTAMRIRDIPIVRKCSKFARFVAVLYGYNPSTQQRMTRDGSAFYTFRLLE